MNIQKQQVARDNPVWVQAVAEMVAGGEKSGSGSGKSGQKVTARLPNSELFTYGIGQSWVFCLPPSGRAVQYTVRDCFVRNTTQCYIVDMVEDGDVAVNTAELSASRLRYLINFYLSRAVCGGKRKALPIPKEIVVEWYAQMRAAQSAEKARAQHMLATHKQYAEQLKKLKSMEIESAKAEVCGDAPKAEVLERETKALRGELANIREGLGITNEVLRAAPHCALCNDRGILSNSTLCPCVKQHEHEIRTYWRRERGEADT